MPNLIWLPQAREDILDIYTLIGLEQPASAERYFDSIEAKAERLITRPRLGPRRSDIWPGIRMLVEAPYLLFYRTDPDTDDGPITTVEIARILDGRRKLPRLLVSALGARVALQAIRGVIKRIARVVTPAAAAPVRPHPAASAACRRAARRSRAGSRVRTDLPASAAYRRAGP
jgi:toxin ParE1/3/4